MSLTKEELDSICELTVKLTELRQNECGHLCIENFAPDLFYQLYSTLLSAKEGAQFVDSPTVVKLANS